MDFINKFRKFMYGRYGSDELCYFLFGSYMILWIFNIFMRNPWISIIELVLTFFMFYRFFSKKIYKRRKENQIFLKWKKSMTKPFLNVKRNRRDKEHIYKKCRKCKKTLKLSLPDKRGFHHAKCPNCKSRVTLWTWKKQKIEIIKNKERMTV